MLAPGAILQNRYFIVRLLGQGGMGAVYQATDQRLGKTVALKETLFSDEATRKAFEREARLLASLHHPALPDVSDHFVEADGQFLVMRFIEGHDLAELLKRRGSPFPPGEVLAWAEQLLDALEYLHSQQPPVIHRDIKPQNIKLNAQGRIILLDFGLAKGRAAGMTTAGASHSVFGYTPTYAPLEQVHGKGTDPRSDLYSLGVTLYHLLIGVVPPDAVLRLIEINNGEPDPVRRADEVSPNVPEAVALALQNAMALRRDDRPATASEMRRALRPTGAQTTQRDEPPTVRQKKSEDAFPVTQVKVEAGEVATKMTGPRESNRNQNATEKEFKTEKELQTEKEVKILKETVVEQWPPKGDAGNAPAPTIKEPAEPSGSPAGPGHTLRADQGSAAHFTDYYELLGVKRGATQDQIKQAFHNIARAHQSNMNLGDKSAEEKLKEIHEAYEVLSDPEKRSLYDRFGHSWKELADVGNAFGSGRERFEEIMNELFGGGSAKAQRGQDAEAEMEISLEEAQRGGHHRVTIQSAKVCSTCNGSGKSGNVLCATCKGAGKVTGPRTVEVNIPAGVREGSVLRLAKLGDAGVGGGEPGDLFIKLKIKPQQKPKQWKVFIIVLLIVGFLVAMLIYGVNKKPKGLTGKGGLKPFSYSNGNTASNKP